MNIRIIGLVICSSLLAAAIGYWLHGALPQQTQIAIAPAAAPKERKILYYRNPMGLSDTSPAPKKDAMGMDYVPVYDDEQKSMPDAPGAVSFDAEKMQKLGVRTEVVALRELSATVRASGTIEADERSQYNVAPKFEGWIEKLYVNATGQTVAAGQALAEIYSPDLIAAQREYLIAQRVEAKQDGDKPLSDAALQRLRNWGIDNAQLEQLRKSGESRTLVLTAPASGVVVEKPSVAGMRFMPGEVLFKMANLSHVWLNAEVFEQDIGKINLGAQARINITAYPGNAFSGKVDFIYPTLNPETRTGKVRIELPNPDGLLKPAMFAQVELRIPARQAVVAVPDSAVIDSGVRQIVLVARGDGKFEPREVRLGNRSENYVEVLSGIAEGEQVVVAANFLIDAESNLKAALGGFGHADHGGGTPKEKEGASGATERPTAVQPSGNEHAGH